MTHSISESANAFYSEVAERIRASIPNSILYTAPWFVQAYVPQMATWAGRYRLWLALYPYRSRRYATWDEFRKTINVLTPSFPTWGQSWEFWQFADNHSFLPGVPRGVDLNSAPSGSRTTGHFSSAYLPGPSNGLPISARSVCAVS